MSALSIILVCAQKTNVQIPLSFQVMRCSFHVGSVLRSHLSFGFNSLEFLFLSFLYLNSWFALGLKPDFFFPYRCFISWSIIGTLATWTSAQLIFGGRSRSSLGLPDLTVFENKKHNLNLWDANNIKEIVLNKSLTHTSVREAFSLHYDDVI